MGAVYKVADTLHEDRILALKIMKKLGGENEETYHRLFKREFEVLAGLEHPHIARAFDYGPILDGSGYFFTSEFVRGIDLLKGTRGVGTENLIEVMVQCCRALDYVHSRGLIHHDLKPDNILLTEPEAPGGDETSSASREIEAEIEALETYLEEILIEKRIVKIIDFGLIMGEREDSRRLFGTPQYMPPEKIKGERCGRQGDLYSLGVVFYHIFTRRLPFTAATMKELFAKVLEDEPVPPREYFPEIPGPVEEIILRLMAKDPAERFNRAAEVIVELNRRLGRDYSLESDVSAEGYITSAKCVGREKEMIRVRESAEVIFGEKDPSEVSSPPCNMFLITGEDGIGKTRLVRELKMEFQLKDVVLFDLELKRYKKNTALFVRDILGTLEEDPVFQREADPAALERARAYGDVDGAGSVPPEVLDFLITGITLASRNRPVCMVTGNLAEAASPVVDFILRLSRILSAAGGTTAAGEAAAGSAYAFIGLMEIPLDVKPYPVLRRVKEELDDPERFCRIVLEPLGENDVGMLISSMFGQGYVPRGFLERLYGATKGNPRYIFEVLREFIARRTISRKGSTWRFDKHIEKIDPPPSYQEALLQQVKNVDADTRRILAVVGLIRDDVPVRYVQAITGYPEEDLRFKLSVLEKRNILRLEGGESGDSCRLAFDFLYGAVGEGMPAEERERLTGMLGEMLEKEVTVENREELSVHLADLFVSSHDVERAVRYGIRAGEFLVKSNRTEEIRQLYERLVPLFTQERYLDFIKVGSKLAEIYEIHGEYRKAIGLYRKILEWGDVILKGWNKALIYRKITHLLVALGKCAEAAETLKRGEEFIISGAESLESGFFAASGGLLEFRRGRFKECLLMCRRAESLIGKFGDGSSRVRKESISNRFVMGGALFHTGEFAESREVLSRVLEEARAVDFAAVEAASLNMLGRICIETGEFAEADRLLESALHIFRERNDAVSLQEVHLNLTLKLLYLNRYMECLDRLEKILLESADREGYENVAGKAYALLGRLNRYFGRHSAARRNFAKSISCFHETGNEYLGCSAVADCAEHYIDVNELDEAEKWLKRAAGMAVARGYRDIEARIASLRMYRCCKAKDLGGAREQMVQMRRMADSFRETYTHWHLVCGALLRQALFLPEALDLSAAEGFKDSPFADVPFFSCCLAYARGMHALGRGDRDAAWNHFREVHALAERYHFMEIYLFASLQLNTIHVFKTGNITNRFLNEARRALEKIERELEDEDKERYLSTSVIRDSHVLVVEDTGEGPVRARSIGNIWAEKTAVGGSDDVFEMKTRVSSDGLAVQDDSSDFIGKGIEEELAATEQVQPMPVHPEDVQAAAPGGETGTETVTLEDMIAYPEDSTPGPGRDAPPPVRGGGTTGGEGTALAETMDISPFSVPEKMEVTMAEQNDFAAEGTNSSTGHNGESSKENEGFFDSRAVPPPPPREYVEKKGVDIEKEEEMEQVPLLDEGSTAYVAAEEEPEAVEPPPPVPDEFSPVTPPSAEPAGGEEEEGPPALPSFGPAPFEGPPAIPEDAPLPADNAPPMPDEVPPIPEPAPASSTGSAADAEQEGRDGGTASPPPPPVPDLSSFQAEEAAPFSEAEAEEAAVPTEGSPESPPAPPPLPDMPFDLPPVEPGKEEKGAEGTREESDPFDWDHLSLDEGGEGKDGDA